MRYRIEFILFQLFKWFVLALPLKSAQRLGYYFGSIAFYLLPERRRITFENLRHAFSEKNKAELTSIALGAFRNMGISLIELLWFPNLKDDIIRKLVKPKNIDLMLSGFSAGKGMVMLSGHFGNWELIALSIAYLSKIPITIVVQTQDNRLVDKIINHHRCIFGNKVIPMGMSVREIIRTLQSGGIVAIAPDQSASPEGVYVEFFGRMVTTHQGPAVFALRSKAPLQIGFIIRQPDGTYEVVLEEIPFSDLDGYNEGNVKELTRRHTAVLEKYIRKYPDQWLWMHRRWKHTLGEAAPQTQTMVDAAN